MSITEKTAYLRGLADGLKLAERESDESRLLLAVIDALDEVAQHVEANAEAISAMADELEELDDVVSGMEEQIEGRDEDESTTYELECPECGAPVILDEQTVFQGETNCPSCGAKLSIDVGYEEE